MGGVGGERKDEMEGTERCRGVLRGRKLLCLLLPALKVTDDTQNLFRKYREQELENRRNVYR